MMRTIKEIIKSEAMERFISRPKFVLGAILFFAGTTLLLTDAL